MLHRAQTYSLRFQFSPTMRFLFNCKIKIAILEKNDVWVQWNIKIRYSWAKIRRISYDSFDFWAKIKLLLFSETTFSYLLSEITIIWKPLLFLGDRILTQKSHFCPLIRHFLRYKPEFFCDKTYDLYVRHPNFINKLETQTKLQPFTFGAFFWITLYFLREERTLFHTSFNLFC